MSPSPQKSPGVTAPYRDGAEHLEHELARVNALAQAFTLRWETEVLGVNGDDPEGVRHRLQAFRATAFRWTERALHGDYQTALTSCLENARQFEKEINRRLAQTPHAVRLPVNELQHLFQLTQRQSAQPLPSNTLPLDVLLLALLMELSPAHRSLIDLFQQGVRRDGLPTHLALRILQPESSPEQYAWQTFAPDGPLARNGLVMPDEIGSGEPIPRRAVRLDSRLVDFLLGGSSLDPRLVGIAHWQQRERTWDQLYLDSAEVERLQRLAGWWRERAPSSAGLLLWLHGGYGTPRLEAAETFCSNTSQAGILVVNVPAALRRPDDWPGLVTACHREARLRGCALFWQGAEVLLTADQPPDRWDAFLAQAEARDGLTFIGSEVGWEPAGRFRDPSHHFVRVDFPSANRVIRRRIWTDRLEAVGVRTAGVPQLELLANAFQFTEGQIDDTLATARGLHLYRGGNADLWWEHLYEACRRQSARRLVTFAQRIEPRPDLSLDDLVLPPPNRRQMEELSDRVSRRDHVHRALGFEERLTLGRGLITLFTGASGTGKTMAAALLAGTQRVDLYKVDLAAVVSKYVGETEKNLGRLFSEAQDANAILFFDEADAVFGKRGEVEDARDRWANLEINYLLQRVEEYKGTVILATNLRQNIDEAFLRRIHVIVEFPFPDADARRRIYEGCFPVGVIAPAPSELQELAERFTLSGGSIKNVVLDAAFRAPPAVGPPAIALRHMVAAVGREYQKLGKPVTPGDFGPVFFDWAKEDLLLGAEGRRPRGSK